MKNIINKLNKKTQVIIINSFDNINQVILGLKEGKCVIVNAARLVNRDGYRVIDFLCGYCFALDGKYKRIDKLIYQFEI